MTGMNTDSAGEPVAGGRQLSSFAQEASNLWALAADRSRWGFVDEAAELRRLATTKRVQAVLAVSVEGRPRS